MNVELLSKVLEIDITHCSLCKGDADLFFVDKDGGSLHYIYELSHKCKSYVVKNSGWTLQSYTNERGAGICRVKVGDGQEINKFIDTSEVNAVFKATEWVYNEIKKKEGKYYDVRI